jgi:SAM-dependent methyltransferase
MSSQRKKTSAKKKRKRGPESRDLHRLYELAVQSPDANLHFCDREYKKKNGAEAQLLREDFCGTAFLSADWVKKRPTNRAIGVDLDGPTLRWGEEHNIVPLGEDASRVKLTQADVRSVHEPKADIVTAFNFSYFVFKTLGELREYFASVRKSLAPGGIFVLDIFGGWEAQMDVTDKTRYKGFTYIWDQKGIDPVTNNGVFHIHFKFHDEGGIKKAFVYDWRLWSIPEVRDALESVGFGTVEVFWEGVDEDGDGNGIFRRVKKAENCPGWNAFVVGS